MNCIASRATWTSRLMGGLGGLEGLTRDDDDDISRGTSEMRGGSDGDTGGDGG
jgi:hypothetical protein